MRGLRIYILFFKLKIIGGVKMPNSMNDDVKKAVALIKNIDKAENDAELLKAFGEAQYAVKAIYLRKFSEIK